MGFASYFLIVGDFVRFAVENGIPCSARGSACGALVSYVLNSATSIRWSTTCCSSASSIPTAREAPDIDIDFCQDRREEVIAYVRQKYGEEQRGPDRHLRHPWPPAPPSRTWAGCSTCRWSRVNELTKMIPQTLGITLDEALQQNAGSERALRQPTRKSAS